MLKTIILLILGSMAIANEGGEIIDQYKPEGVDIYVNSATHTQEKKPITVKEVYNSSYKSNYKKDKVKELDSYEVVPIKAEEWLCKYADNTFDDKVQWKMRRNWSGKFIKLTGKVYQVNNDYIDGCRITFKQQRNDSLADGWCMICCYFYSDSDKEKAMQYKSGDTVTIIGYSKWDLGPTMINCSVR